MGQTTKKSKRDEFHDLRSEGRSVSEAALAVGIAASTGYQWSSAARQAQANGRRASRMGGGNKSTPRFARLYPQSQAPSPRIELEVAGVVIRLDNGFNAEVLGKVLAAVRGGS